MIDDAIAVRFPIWLIIRRSFTDFFLLEIWYFSMWPISWAITPINASGLFMYLSKPVVKYIVFSSFIKALGWSSSIIENCFIDYLSKHIESIKKSPPIKEHKKYILGNFVFNFKQHIY